ncbi:MAG TPA: TonB-dependent receptor, partial [Saprospiraceae bacterium]|nr:TonB-dependent receptor [Saprospiraceae bacterium]
MVTVCRVLTRLRNIIILALLFFTSISFTQSFINGKIIDSISLKPVEFALIVAYDNNNTPFESASSDSLGNFQIQIPNNVILNYLESQFLGYNQKKILLEDFKVNQNIIFLKSNNNMLDAVDIKADRISNLQTIDKQIFNASQYKNAKGGTALDIIKNLPSISLNAEEALTIRGAKGVVIMLNGRPITVDPNTILSQISAENIENIEVITSPSSKYDPDGLGGIINIKSKLINTDGYSFNVSVNGGLPSIENYDNKKPQQRYGITTSYNYRKDKFDILLGADFLRDDRSGQRIGYVNTLIDDKLTEFPSAGERSLDQTNYALNLSLNYKVSQQSNINLSAYKGQRYQARTADILYNQQRSFIARDRQISPIEYFNNFLASGQNTSDGGILDKQTIYNENLRIRNGDFSFVSLDYTYDFKNSDANLKFSTLYETAQLGGPTDNYNYDGFLKSELYQYQYNSNDNPLDAIRTQIDFNKKIFDLDVDLGIQHRFTMHPGEFIFEELDIARNTLFLVPEFTNRIDLSRNIWSSYFQASGNKQKLKYTFGLRAEITNRTVEIRNPKNTFNFDTLNFFPNLAVDYQVNDAWNIKFGANKRIQRNTTNMLTPFPEREHSETLEQGDAMLVPEYITNFELTVQYKGK